MPGIFTFGVLNSFNFTFRAGPRPCSPAGETTGVKSISSKNKANREVRTLIPWPWNWTGNTNTSPCGTLSKLPLEIRSLIYTRVLTYDKTIKQPHRFLGRHPPIMAGEGNYIEAIDAALLRSCRAIYRETIRILYRSNRFFFQASMDIEDFAYVGLENTPFGSCRFMNKPSAGVNNAPYGRLTMICHVYLKLSSKKKADDLKKKWSSWSAFFYSPEKQDHLVGFPALQYLTLDFTDWKLNARDTSQVRVKPFLRKLRPPGGLKILQLLGVTHEQNLRDFKHGFVKQGGAFHLAASTLAPFAKFPVTHDDLPEVSAYVRAIVEKDKASRTNMENNKNTAIGSLK